MVNPTTRIITVTRRPITYTFDSPTKVYDGNETVSLTGFAFAGTGVPASGRVGEDDVTL